VKRETAADSAGEPVVIDTDVLSYLHNEHSLAAEYRAILDGRQGFVALQSVAEMRFGAILNGWGEPRRLKLETFLSAYTVIEPNDATALLWAVLRAQVQRAGRHTAPSDAWIAATALEYGLILVTHNVDDFLAVDGLRLFSLNEGSS
jgi:predicted nucleic acid-binding protein